jgi:hypothetical protein
VCLSRSTWGGFALKAKQHWLTTGGSRQSRQSRRPALALVPTQFTGVVQQQRENKVGIISQDNTCHCHQCGDNLNQHHVSPNHLLLHAELFFIYSAQMQCAIFASVMFWHTLRSMANLYELCLQNTSMY